MWDFRVEGVGLCTFSCVGGFAVENHSENSVLTPKI